MKFDVITIFPELFEAFLNTSLIGKARERKLISVDIHDLRDFATDKHRTVDDTPYGGGPGMVMKPEPWFAALRAIVGEMPERKKSQSGGKEEIVLLSPRGERLNQQLIESLATVERLILLCGRYEGIDDRVRMRWATREVSLGDFVINGGELAAQVMIEAIARLQHGVLGDPESAMLDSYSSGVLDHRHFTKPAEFDGLRVPEVLLEGNHELIRRWRLRDALKTTYLRRPDLLEEHELTDEEKVILEEIIAERKKAK